MIDHMSDLHGHVVITVIDPSGDIVDVREADNVICSVSYPALVSALAWSGVQDQASQTGSGAAFLTPIYGALGSSNTTPTVSDTQLGAEINPGGRNTVSAAGAASIAWSWLFQFGTSSVSWTIQEAGVFVSLMSGGSIITPASTTPNSGLLFDHALVSPSVTKTTSQTLTAQFTFSF